MAPNGALPLDGSVVKMKGLPFKANHEDIIRFFNGFAVKPDDIYLKRHPDGRPNGEAFVVFNDGEVARRATQKDRETFGEKFGERYVRVYPTLESDVADMESAVAQQHVAAQQGNGNPHIHMDSVVKLKSLPFDATQLDIFHFFEGYKVKPNGVQLVVRSDNKPTGEAFVDFENFEEAVTAIREKDHKVFSDKFGDRYIRLIQVSRKEMQATLALRFGGEGILKVKGIPFKATAVDVRKFFAGYKIKPEGISFIMHSDGRPTGMAFIEFETPQEAVRAMEKDRAKFGPEYGDRFCMLQLVGRHELDKVHLQKESDNTNTRILAAAFATQAAFNPALQPLLLNNHNWLSGLTQAQLAAQLGQLPVTTHALTLDATIAAATQLGAATGLQSMNIQAAAAAAAAAGMNALFLHQQSAPPNGLPGLPTGLNVSSWLNGLEHSTTAAQQLLGFPAGDRSWLDPRLAASMTGPLLGLQSQPLVNLPSSLGLPIRSDMESLNQEAFSTGSALLVRGQVVPNHAVSHFSSSPSTCGDLPDFLASSLPLAQKCVVDASPELDL